MSCKSLASLCIALILACLAIPVLAIKCETFLIPENTHNGSGYTALQCGMDGCVYVGTAMYGGSAHVVRFNPKTKKWDDLFNAHALTRDTGTGLDSQSKFHAKLVVDADGLIWAASKQGNEEFYNRPEYGESATGFPGGHLFSINPKTNQVIDHGILVKQEGIMGGVIDRARKRIYYMTDPKGHFIIYDIAQNTVRDFGYAAPAARYMAIDKNGRVFAHGGTPPGAETPYIFMYDPQTDQLLQLAVIIDGPGAKDYLYPYVMVSSAEGDHILACTIGGKYVMDFDLNSITLDRSNPLANGSIHCKHIPEGVPDGKPGGDQHAGTLGKDGCFYFNSDHILMRYNPYMHVVENLGTIEVSKGEKLGSSQGACVAPDGTLYMKFIYPYEIIRFPKLTARRGN